MSGTNNFDFLIPAFNEAGTLAVLIAGIREEGFAGEIVIVDDGSTDATADVAKSAAGVTVLSHSTNRGKGEALKTGFNHLIGRSQAKEPNWIITMDADLQHLPASLSGFIEAAESGRFDLIIGARQRFGTAMPLHRRFSNGLTSRLMSLATARKIQDAQCGFRCIRLELLRSIKLSTSHYDLESELIFKAVRLGARIGWVDIPTTYNGASSGIHGVADTVRFVRLFWRHMTDALYREAANVSR
ncbi:MAG: glycosyltransferase family 2 protein [Calditrichaeota bacterium]|nr:glycosyltransferase family 2 protein [Calditrichota bacterium]